MLKFFTILPLLVISGCASLPENYSDLDVNQLIRGISSNNKPKIMPANLRKKEGNGIVMITANYNVVGSYTSGAVLDSTGEGIKYCTDHQGVIIAKERVSDRSLFICKLQDNYFVGIHLLSKERAGFDTGETYAYFDHIAYFEVASDLSANKVDWISSHYISFEADTINPKRVLDYNTISANYLNRELEKYTK